MECFLRYWALLVAQHGKSNSHDAARVRPSETDRQRAVKNQDKKLLLVNRRCGRHELGRRFAPRASTGRAHHKVSCRTNV
ncbi:MAG TPA: hypothetical protein VEK55_03710 [Xanthobacteraceae bacterium]|nr:hypothetical protein [Xanthobacteraceae bacterium]